MARPRRDEALDPCTDPDTVDVDVDGMTEGTSESDSGSTTPHQRVQWNSRLSYLLSLIGCCVGFGNLWRFPYICNRNGGGAFLLPFLLCLFVIGFPMFFLEAALSQFSGLSTPRVWSFCPILKGVGIGILLSCTAFTIGYNILLAWSIYYMVKSCSSVLPWTTCGNSWNTDLCVEGVRSSTLNSNMTSVGNGSNTEVVLWENDTLAHSAAEEFWQYNALGISSGLEEVGSVQWHMVGCLFASSIVLCLCMVAGIKSTEKVVYVTAVVPYILLVTIFIRVLMLPGAGAGLLYYVTPDFSRLLHAQVWLEACIQVMFSLAVGWGLIGTASSYNKFHEPCLRDAIIVTAVSEGTSIFAGCVVFATLGVMSETTGVPISRVVSSGPGLAFVVYPEALFQLPMPQIWSFLFFLVLFTVGLDSQFMNIEVLTTALVDKYSATLTRRRHLVTAGVCGLSFLLGILFCTQGGPYISQLLDWYLGALSVMLFCTLECVAVAWIYGLKQFSKDIEMMLGKPLATPFKILWAFVLPAVLLAVFILSLLRYEPPSYGKYTYPGYASAIGWFVASAPLIPLPIFAVKAVRKHLSSQTLTESIKLALRPEQVWCPADPLRQEEYQASLKNTKYSVRNKLTRV